MEEREQETIINVVPIMIEASAGCSESPEKEVKDGLPEDVAPY